MKRFSARVSEDGLNGNPPALELLDKESGEVLEKLSLRNPSPSDKSFVLATWIRSYAPVLRRGRWVIAGASYTAVTQEVYLREEPAVAESMWEKGLVVGSTDDFTVYAWICGSPGKLYHCYVIPELRSKGIAKALIQYVCGPKLEYARPWPFERIPNGWAYNPYLLRKDG